MATFTQIDRAKAWLDKTGLKQTNQPLYQIILVLIDTLRQAQIEINTAAASGGGTGSGITALSGDVVATGPGAAVATIQPNVVTYAKIQQVTGARLLGNPTGSTANVDEISLGDNLEFDGNVLESVQPGGSIGLDHDLLSATHPDTDPAEPQIGDLIRAVEGAAFDGVYYYYVVMMNLAISSPMGVYAGYMPGYDNLLTAPVSEGYTAYPWTLAVPEPTETWISQGNITAYVRVLVENDAFGIYGYYNALTPGQYPTPDPGDYAGYTPPEFELVPTEDPALPDSGAIWQRMPIATDGDVLTLVDGLPEWVTPDPITYPDQSWQDIPFDAADFTASGGTTPTWTVSAGNVERWQKQYSYNSLGTVVAVRYALYLRDTTVGGTAPDQLQIAIPEIIIGRFAISCGLQENVVAQFDAFVEYNDGVSTTQLTINKVGGAVFDTTAGETFVGFEISAVLAP